MRYVHHSRSLKTALEGFERKHKLVLPFQRPIGWNSHVLENKSGIIVVDLASKASQIREWSSIWENREFMKALRDEENVVMVFSGQGLKGTPWIYTGEM